MVSLSNQDAWGVVYGDPSGEPKDLEIIQVFATEERARQEALNLSFHNDGDPFYFVMPVYRKQEIDK